MPVVLGEAVIPGLSDYMHPLGDDHLLTIVVTTGMRGRLHRFRRRALEEEGRRFLRSAVPVHRFRRPALEEESRRFRRPALEGEGRRFLRSAVPLRRFRRRALEEEGRRFRRPGR